MVAPVVPSQFERTMPAHQRLRPDDRHGLEDCRKPAIQLDEEQPIAIRELDATAHLALQHGQLLPERDILRLKSALGLKSEETRFKNRKISPTTVADVILQLTSASEI
jgi:hypothetical protein